jgi:hypothetical protein
MVEPQTLWDRLDALDAHCIVRMESHSDRVGNGVKRWRVVVLRRHDGDATPIVVDDDSVLECLQSAVDMAHALHWEREEPGPTQLRVDREDREESSA